MLSFLLPQTELRGVLGSIVQLDGRSARDSNGLPVTLEWSFVSVPLSSTLTSSLSVINPSTLTVIRPDHRAVSFIPDVLGTYVVQAVASNGTSSITQTATIHIRLTLVPSAQGGVPDMGFIWQYMASFYNLVEDREVFQVVWSSMVQLLGADLTTLYTNDYNKSLKTIQPTLLRRWQRFSMRTNLDSQAQSVVLGNTASGILGESGPFLKDTTKLKTRVFRADDSNFPAIDVNYKLQGRILEVDGTGHQIVRAYNLSDAVASVSIIFTVSGTTFTNISASVDTTTGSASIWAADQDYIYLGNTGSFSEIVFVFGSVSSADLTLTFEYSNGTGWTSFTPTSEGTNGGRQSGTVVLGSLGSWARQTENGLTYFWVRIRRTTSSGSSPSAQTIRNKVTQSVLVLSSETLTNGLQNQSYRVSHLLHTPSLDLEKVGVSAGDILVLEVRRGDSELTAELNAQVLAVQGTRLTFEINLETLSSGSLGLDIKLFETLVTDLRVISAGASNVEITAAAKTFINFIPTGINVSNRPFSDYLFTIKAKQIIHNTRVAIDTKYVSIPTLVWEINDNPSTIYLENTNYIVSSGWLTFQPGVFSLTNPSKEEYWAECSHIDNLESVENNFGKLVGLSRDDLTTRQTRAPYLPAVKGLWYSIMNGPSVANIRLALHILMGLPFTEERGEVIAIDTSFSVDATGISLGRLLVEDVDEEDQRLGVRRFYYFPTSIGLALNASTGLAIQVGDILEAFIPLSQGVIVEDIYNNSTWWLRNLRGQEIRKFFLFSAQIDTATGVFDENDLSFSIEFLRTLIPIYADLVSSVIQRLSDNDILSNFSDPLTGSITSRFYDNVGQLGKHESTFRADDWNHQGALLQHAGSTPFQTVSDVLLTDLVTSQDGTDVLITSATGFGGARARQIGTTTTPSIEGDLVYLWANQPGSNIHSGSFYEFTSLINQTQGRINNIPPINDPTTFAENVLDASTFTYASNLKGSVLRRGRNPISIGSNGSVSSGVAIFASSTGTFISDGVQIGDLLVIESGANVGSYLIQNTVVQTNPPDLTSTGTVQITNTSFAFVNLDGTVPSPTLQIDINFRIIRQRFRKKVYAPVRVVNDSSVMRIEVLDFGQSPETPFDIFSPDMVGQTCSISLAQNPLNNGVWTISAYEHAGRVSVTGLGPNVSDTSAQAQLTLNDLEYGFDTILDLGIEESFSTTVV